MWQVSWLASCCWPSHLVLQRDNGMKVNNKLISSQLRVQLRILINDFWFLNFDFRTVLKSTIFYQNFQSSPDSLLMLGPKKALQPKYGAKVNILRKHFLIFFRSYSGFSFQAFLSCCFFLRYKKSSLWSLFWSKKKGNNPAKGFPLQSGLGEPTSNRNGIKICHFSYSSSSTTK